MLPIYFPLTAENFNPEYNGLRIKFPDAGYWGNFLHTFHHSMADSWISEKRKASQQLYHTDYVDLSSFCERISRTRTQEDYYSESLIGHDFFGEGTARSFQEDDDYITYALPFDFPFFGTVIQEDTTIYISSNGYIDFDSQKSKTKVYQISLDEL